MPFENPEYCKARDLSDSEIRAMGIMLFTSYGKIACYRANQMAQMIYMELLIDKQIAIIPPKSNQIG